MLLLQMCYKTGKFIKYIYYLKLQGRYFVVIGLFYEYDIYFDVIDILSFIWTITIYVKLSLCFPNNLCSLVVQCGEHEYLSESQILHGSNHCWSKFHYDFLQQTAVFVYDDCHSVDAVLPSFVEGLICQPILI